MEYYVWSTTYGVLRTSAEHRPVFKFLAPDASRLRDNSPLCHSTGAHLNYDTVEVNRRDAGGSAFNITTARIQMSRRVGVVPPTAGFRRMAHTLLHTQ